MFVTHGVLEEALQAHYSEWLEKGKKAVDDSAELLGLFHCQGEVAQFVIDALSKSDDPVLQYFAKMSPQTKGQPDESRIKLAKEFAQQIMDKFSS